MPRININEKDNTSPGTPGSYANYSVLIAGFTKYSAAELAAKEIQPDDNGVYEFTSADDFMDTIGAVAPKIKPAGGNFGDVPDHYGNQMAYELLKMGYPVIYLPIGQGAGTKAEIVERLYKLEDEDTWAIFKDKASYDFRFVISGLLKSNLPSTDLSVKFNEVSKYNYAIGFLTDAYDAAVKAAAPDAVEADIKANALASAVSTESTKVNTEPYKSVNYISPIIGAQDMDTATYDTVLRDLTKCRDDAVKAASDFSIENHEYTTANLNAVNGVITNLASYVAQPAPMEDEMAPNSGRGDCVALIELDERTYTQNKLVRPEVHIVNAINEMASVLGSGGKYAAITVPSVTYKMSDDARFAGNKKFPGGFHYLACFKQSLNQGFAEWYAAAGYTRGVSSYVIDSTSVKLGEIAINTLEPRYIKDQKADPVCACNVIANFRGSYYLWGNRTCEPLQSYAGGGDLIASHFLNIRQLCTTLKKQLYVACRRFTFDPNSDVLWINFCEAIKPTLERMKADQGVRDYQIVKVATDKKATLKAKVRIIPIEAVEDFILEVSLEDSFGETTATVTE